MAAQLGSVEVTLTKALYRALRTEALRLDVPMEWVIASLIVDTIDEAEPGPDGVAA